MLGKTDTHATTKIIEPNCSLDFIFLSPAGRFE